MIEDLQLRPYVERDEWNIEPVEPTLRCHPAYEETWRTLVHPERTWTALWQNQTIAVGGYIGTASGRARVWALVAQGLPATVVVEAMQRGLALVRGRGYRRMEMIVAADFAAGAKLALALGFEPAEQTEHGQRYERSYG